MKPSKLPLYIYLIISILLLNFCKNHDKSNLSATKIKDISIPIRGPFFHISNGLRSKDGGGYITIQDQTLGTIEVIKFDSTGVLSNSSIDRTSLHGGKFFQIFIQNLDSIYIFNGKARKVILLDSLGNTLSENNIKLGLPVVTPINPLFVSDNCIITGNTDSNYNVGKKDGRAIYYKVIKPVYLLNLNSTSIKKELLFGNFPLNYVESNSNYFNFFPYICTTKSHDILLSFSASDSIYLYTNGKLKNCFECVSEYIDKFNPYPDEKIFDLAYYQRYIQTEPNYLSIIYDKYRDKYYRIVRHRTNYTKENTLESNHWTWSILILDSNFKLEKELLFDYRNYYSDFIIPTHEGIYIGKTLKSRTDTALILSLFKF
jgi:hypothetical protein